MQLVCSDLPNLQYFAKFSKTIYKYRFRIQNIMCYLWLYLTFLLFSCVDLSHNRLEDQTITNVFFNMEKLVSQSNSIILLVNVLPNKDIVHNTLLTLASVGGAEGYCNRLSVCLSVCLSAKLHRTYKH